MLGFDSELAMKHLRLIAFSTCGLVAGYGTLIAACSSDTVITDSDSGTDTGLPDNNVPDTGGPETSIDAGLTISSFRAQLGESLCQSISRCCYGNATVDAGETVDSGTKTGKYDQAKCLTQLRKVGFESS